MPETSQLDLDVPRGPGALFKTTLTLFAQHSGLFLSVTLLIVAPIAILVDGVWARRLVDGADADVPLAAAVAGSALQTVIPVLVTALHVVIVRNLADGRAPAVVESLRSAAPRFPVAVAGVLLYSVLVFGGFVLLVLPGIWLLVLGYFTAQAIVLERCGPFDAFRRSAQLVRGRWWRTAWTLLLGWVVLAVASFPLKLAVATVDDGVAYVSLFTIVQALELSLSALFGTLLYFSLRARKEHPSPSVPTPA